MRFKNKDTGFIEQSNYVFLWTLLFGVFYFLVKRVWNHALISCGVALMTAGLSWFIYPFFSKKILRKFYLRNGWIEIDENGNEIPIKATLSK